MGTHPPRKIVAQPLSPSAFRPYGQVIVATDDPAPFGPRDAQLQLQNGMPRLYIMRLYRPGRQFHQITRHRSCTQCLGSLSGKAWLLGVAPAGTAALPSWEAVVVFRIPADCFVKLEVGTWHAGPYFDEASIDFYNLELSDTNLVDHDTCDLLEHYGIEFEIV